MSNKCNIFNLNILKTDWQEMYPMSQNLQKLQLYVGKFLGILQNLVKIGDN